MLQQDFFNSEKNPIKRCLREKFIIEPFSILNANKWVKRKKQWIDLGIKGELGRDNNLTYGKGLSEEFSHHQTSIFDPVLCEVLYNWFSVKNDKIIDPFAGGGVRGIIANFLGRDYLGIDISKRQIDANIENAKEIIKDNMPKYLIGDSLSILDNIENNFFDMCLSCPPYADLEKYSDDEKDLSNMCYDDFINAYAGIIKKLYNKMKDNTFTCFVVGEVRNKKSKNGNYYNFVADTINIFISAGFEFYNDMILETLIGSAAFRCQLAFNSSRKITKIHQNILVFVKGNAKKAADRLNNGA